MLECVVNVSEGRDATVLRSLETAAGADLLDRHTDPHHHRSVLTLVGEEAPRRVAEVAIERIDLRKHSGVHPRLGVLDVVPFVPLAGSTLDDAVVARDEFAAWLVERFDVPVFRYGEERTLPEVRRRAFVDLPPDLGPAMPHPSAGATSVGARRVLVAYNVWLDHTDVGTARRIAASVRGPTVRALGLAVGDRIQVSMNLVAPDEVGPADAYDRVAQAGASLGVTVAGAELVGLVPGALLERVPADRWRALDLGPERTIEARLGSG